MVAAHVLAASTAARCSKKPGCSWESSLIPNQAYSVRITAPAPSKRRKGEVMPIIEIRAAEGGEDAKLLVDEQLSIYLKLARRRGL